MVYPPNDSGDGGGVDAVHLRDFRLGVPVFVHEAEVFHLGGVELLSVLVPVVPVNVRYQVFGVVGFK